MPPGLQWIELARLVEERESLMDQAPVPEDIAHEQVPADVIRLDLQKALGGTVETGRLLIAPMDPGFGELDLGQVGGYLRRFPGHLPADLHVAPAALLRVRPVRPIVAVEVRQLREGRRIPRVELDAGQEHRLGVPEDFRLRDVVVPVGEMRALEVGDIGFRAAAAEGSDPRGRGRSQLLDQGPPDLLGDIVLNGKDVPQVAVIVFRPRQRAVGRADQLGGQPDPVA